MTLSEELQSIQDHFGFVVVGFTHPEDAEQSDREGVLGGDTYHELHGYARIHAHVSGVASKDDWDRQQRFMGASTALMESGNPYRAYRKIVAE